MSQQEQAQTQAVQTSKPTTAINPKTVRAYHDLRARMVRNAIARRTQRGQAITEHTDDSQAQHDPGYYTPSTRDLIEDLAKNEEGYKHSTLIKLRNAILYFAEMAEDFANAEYLRSKDFLEGLKSNEGDGNTNSRPSRRTIPEDHFNMIRAELLKSRKKNGRRIDAFLMATFATGARPSEWLSAKWIDIEKGIIEFKNAKSKSRSPLNTRKIDNLPEQLRIKMQFKEKEISYRQVEIEPELIKYVIEHKQYLDGFMYEEWGKYPGTEVDGEWREKAFKSYFDSARITLHRVSEKLFGENNLYSLYDARSTYGANQRARLGTDKASKMMGHAVGKKSIAHYGNSYKAWSGYKKLGKERMAQEQADRNNTANTAENINLILSYKVQIS